MIDTLSSFTVNVGLCSVPLLSAFILLSPVHTHLCAKGLPGSLTWRQSWEKEKETVLPWKPISLSSSMISDPSWIWEHEGCIIAQTCSAAHNTRRGRDTQSCYTWMLKCFWTAALCLTLCLSLMTDCSINSFHCLFIV